MQNLIKMESFNGIIITLILLITANLNVVNGEDDKVPLLTQTVYGFLDFTTTMGNTVMVFSPQSAPALVLPNTLPTPEPIIKTKPTNKDAKESNQVEGANINPTKSEFDAKPKKVATTTTANNLTPDGTTILSLKSSNEKNDSKTVKEINKVITGTATTAAAIVNNVIIKADIDTIATPGTPTTQPPITPLSIENDLHSPEYNLLSRQPPQFVEESYRVVNLKQTSQPASPPTSFNKNIRSNTAVVVTPEKSTDSSVVVATTTTTTATAGAVKSSSNRSHKNNKKHSKLRPSGTLQVLKTASPTLSGKSPSSSSGTRHVSSSASRKNGKKGSQRAVTTTTAKVLGDVVTSRPSNTRTKPKRRKSKNKNHSNNAKPKYERTTTSALQETTTRRAFRPKAPNHHNTDVDNNNNSNNNNNYNNNNNNNLHITKLNRAPGRWQYKTTPKPRVTIRKPLVESNANIAGPLGLTNLSLINAVTESLFNDNINNNFIINNQSDLESSGSQNGGSIVNNIDGEKNGIGIDGKQQKFFTETINVEISTPADFKDTYYEIATIKKPFIFQAGILKKTRYITVTSTIEKYLTTDTPQETHTDDGPLTENILASTSQPENFLVGSITTLSPIFVGNDADTPLLETVTDTFSIINKKIKTQILPIVKLGIENETSYHTLLQTIDLTSLITVTKTVSPLMESKYFNDFKDFVGNLDEAGSEFNLDLEFGDETNNHDNGNGDEIKKIKNSDNQLDQLLIGKDNKTIITSPPSLSPSHIQSSILLSSTVDIQNFLPHTLPALPTVITNSRPVINLETLWESYVIPVTNGQSTTFKTLSKAKGIVEKTDYILETTTLPIAPPTILPPSTINPFLIPQQQQHYQTITSPIVQQTIATQTQSKVLKLTFGAKTAYTTLYSTQVVPTLQTLYVTTSIPVQHTANPFPGFFPPAYNPFAYLG